MSLQVRSVPIVTDGTGVASATVRAGGCKLLAVEIEIGTLTTPDILITDEDSGRELVNKTGLAADAHYTLGVQLQDTDGTDLTGAFGVPVVTGRMEIAISGAGAAKTGRVVLVMER
jgi:hypothetical protein